MPTTQSMHREWATAVSNLTGSGSEELYGANEWLVEEMYRQWLTDKQSVDQAWWSILEQYAATADRRESQAQPEPSAMPSPSEAAQPAQPPAEPVATSSASPAPQAHTTGTPARPEPIPADVPVATTPVPVAQPQEDQVFALKGVAKTLAANMDASVTVPTATSVRTVPAKLMIDNRIVINNHLARARGGKISYTHLIGWALIRALKMFPSQNVFYAEIDGKPSLVKPAHIGLGIAIDLPKPDGSRSLMVPAIRQAETLNFNEYLVAYEDLVQRARAGKLVADDFSGGTISLTNPGGIGTVHSVPRLMPGQGSIIGAGALEYPAEFQGASEATLADLAISKTLTLTSTYDHRVIQGAGSGEFLKLVHELLIGQHGFYEDIFTKLRIPYAPIRWAADLSVDTAEVVDKTARVQELINSYRVRGHLMADIDPLEYRQRTHPDLEIETHGLTFWDLDRKFVTGGFGSSRTMKLRDILGVLRDSYCRTVGIEYMHIQDPVQRRWIQDKVERKYEKPNKEEQLRILSKLNEAEAFETFLQTKYVGQKRFSLEGSESAIAFLDGVLQSAAKANFDEAAIGMAHRGRLNVLSNIAGKTYGQIFREFEGTGATTGTSGDVKYHLGTQGTFTADNGVQMPVTLAANPSHLETVNGVLEGIVRAKQDRKGIGVFSILPILVHGDAAFAGQGVVYETLQLSQLRGYRTGGTIHLVINNQVGFTTLPHDGRSSVYATDVAKTIQAPIFHVNGDDPEAVVRIAELAFEYREAFNRDVVIDLISYRRRGHNEGDDPAMTQPLMYNLIEAKRSVRKLYTEALVGRGDLTDAELEAAAADFQDRLERAFAETHEAASSPIPIVGFTAKEPEPLSEPITTAVTPEVIALIGDAYANKPPGFTVHPKLQQLIDKRVDMSRNGQIDWGFGEILALGSLLLEHTPVRFAGQDSRRGTFVQRHAVFHDRVNGQEWLPLTNLSENQGRFWIYDSLLSEYAALGFEYGYSVERSDALVLWEAQYGDFANGAQTVVDEYLSAAEQKWGQHSSVVMLLPHGYEGQGPDHSSARMERYLQLCAENNMTVARPSTPANYFHLLRQQAYQRPRRPLIVFTPKAMLRLRGATSEVADFTTGGFQKVIDDPRVTDPSLVKRVVECSGKVYYDLLAELEKNPNPAIALVRVEQLYPLPSEELRVIAKRYSHAEFVWVQDEPENQGAWPYFILATNKLGPIPVQVVSRGASASPAVGSPKRHAAEQAELIRQALTLSD